MATRRQTTTATTTATAGSPQQPQRQTRRQQPATTTTNNDDEPTIEERVGALENLPAPGTNGMVIGALIGLCVIVFGLMVWGIVAYKSLPDTNEITSTVVSKLSADLGPQIKAIEGNIDKTNAEVEKIKEATLVGNPTKVAELEAKMVAETTKRDKAQAGIAERLDRADGETKTLMETAKASLEEARKALEEARRPVEVTKKTTVGDAPSPTRFLEEQTLSREVSDAEVRWIRVGKYHLPIWKTNNRGVTSPTEPKLTKPKGLEKAQWVVINGQDWALDPS